MSSSTIQVIRVHEYGEPEQLKLEHVPRPEPQPGEVLVRVHAAGVNPVDWKIRQGLRRETRSVQFPYIPGFDLAGVVEEIGPGVTAFQKGQAVFGQSTKGAYAEYTTASVEALALKPERLSFDEAATIPVGATTAWQGLFDHGDLQTAQSVLIQGAAGGVGLFAVQFARWKGAHVIGTTSTAHLDFVRSLGAETVVDYTSTSVEKAVQEVDLVFDAVGASTLASSLHTVKRGGTLVGIAGLPAEGHAKEHDVRLVSFAAHASSELLGTFVRLINEGQVNVAVSTIFSLQDAQQAQELSQTGHGRGRIVLHIAD